MDGETVSGYISEMDDDALFARVEEAIAEQVREQYAQVGGLGLLAGGEGEAADDIGLLVRHLLLDDLHVLRGLDALRRREAGGGHGAPWEALYPRGGGGVSRCHEPLRLSVIWLADMRPRE